MTLNKSNNNTVSMKSESKNNDSLSTINSNNKRGLSNETQEDPILDIDYNEFSQLDEEDKNELHNSEIMKDSSPTEKSDPDDEFEFAPSRPMEELTQIQNSQILNDKLDNKNDIFEDKLESPDSPLFPPSQLLNNDISEFPSEVDTLMTNSTTELDLAPSPPSGIPVDEIIPQTQPLPMEVLSQDLNQDNYLGRIRYKDNHGITCFHPIFLGSTTLIGRHKRCHIHFDNPTISSEQVTIKTATGTDGNQVLCYNMGSNPTEVNGVLMKKNDCVELKDQTSIVLNHSFALQYRIRKDERVSTSVSTTRYTIEGHTLGVGAYGQVKRGRDNVTGQLVAVKTIKKVAYRNNKATDRKEKIQAEIDIMKPLDHPNVLRVLGVEEDEETICIFLPYISGGDLFGYITSQPEYNIPQDRSRFIFWQLVKALEYLHENQICHRDIKPENILIHNPCDYPKVVLCDFGMAKKYNMTRMQSILGTWNYSAPEIVENLFASMNAVDSQSATTKRQKTDYSYKVDSWSMGVLLFAMLSGTLPFYVDDTNSVESQRKLFRLILRGQFNLNQIPVNNINSQGEDLIKKLLCLNREERLDMKQCENHPWIKQHLTSLEERFEFESQAEADAGHLIASKNPQI